MRRVLIVAAAAIAVLLVAAQLIVPRIVAGQVEQRLEERGGTAAVKVSAWPVATLLFGSGGSIDIAGHDLRYDVNAPRGERPLQRLDTFEKVRIDLHNLDTGPVRVSQFVLTRDGRGKPYRLTVQGRSTPGELARELGAATGGALGGLLGSLATGALGAQSSVQVPLRLDATVDSADGRPNVAQADATVAGVPAGPLTVLVLRAVLDRL